MIDEILELTGDTGDICTRVSNVEILTVEGVATIVVTVVVTTCSRNHHERTLCLLLQTGYFPMLRVLRFNRRLHAEQDVPRALISLPGKIRATGMVFMMDAMPVSCANTQRLNAAVKPRAMNIWAYCASKGKWYSNGRLQLSCDAAGGLIVCVVARQMERVDPGAKITLPLIFTGWQCRGRRYIFCQRPGLVVELYQRLCATYSNLYRKTRGKWVEDAVLICAHHSRIEAVNGSWRKGAYNSLMRVLIPILP